MTDLVPPPHPTGAHAGRPGRRPAALPLLLALTLALAACSSPRHRAPVETRSSQPRPAVAAASAPTSAPTTSPVVPADAPPGTVEARPSSVDASPSAVQAGAGTYIVKPGDTLIRIGLETGQNWRDIARWNGIENPNVLEVGQVLRVVAPVGLPETVVSRPASEAARPADPAAAPDPRVATPGATPASPPPATAPLPPAGDPDGALNWQWPAAGSVLRGFDDTRSKGVAIAGQAGDPVLAAADGRVVYAGSGLRGYGNLVIVKHNNTFLSAYAHNSRLLVKEDDVVRRGQRIAEMGSSDADRVQLHFEIRRQGKPVDPVRYLPPR
jgi:lipoprotein NlpD